MGRGRWFLAPPNVGFRVDWSGPAATTAPGRWHPVRLLPAASADRSVTTRQQDSGNPNTCVSNVMVGSHISYTPRSGNRHSYSSRFGKGVDDQWAKSGAGRNRPRYWCRPGTSPSDRRQLKFRHLADRAMKRQRCRRPNRRNSDRRKLEACYFHNTAKTPRMNARSTEISITSKWGDWRRFPRSLKPARLNNPAGTYARTNPVADCDAPQKQPRASPRMSMSTIAAINEILRSGQFHRALPRGARRRARLWGG
jgi:hypothetical protein